MTRISDGVSKFVLDNGLTVLVKENHAAPVVAIFTYVEAGYFDESDDRVGISHLIEHMFFKGTRERGVGQIAIQTKALGGYLNASTIYDHTLYYTVLPSSCFAQGLAIQSDALMNSVFDPEELQKETEVVIQEAKRKLDTPTAVCREKLFALAFDKHRMGRWRIGTEAGLRALTRDDFVTFHRNLYRPENIILVVVGDIDTDTARQEITRYYEPFERGTLKKEDSPSEPEQTRFRYAHLEGDIKQSHATVGFHTPGMFHDDTYALETVAFLLGQGRSSRLYQEVKESQRLVNTITAYNYSLQSVGIFLVEVGAEFRKLRRAEQAVAKELARLKEQPVTQEELEKTRNHLQALYVSTLQSVAGQAKLLASYEALGGYHLVEDYMQKLHHVTPDDILAVARKYLKLDNCSIFEYVPKGSPDEAGSSRSLPEPWSAEGREVSVKAAAPASTTELTAEQMEQSLRACFATQGKPASAPDPPSSVVAKPTIFIPSAGEEKEMIRYVLDNGAKLLVKESHRLPLVSVGVFAAGGRCRETPDIAGISSLSARMALKGTHNRSAQQIAVEIERLGTSLSVSSDPDTFSCTLNILSRHFDRGWEILTDILTTPSFPDQELRKEKEQTLAHLQRLRDDMFRYPVQLFCSAIFPGHAYGLPVLGTPESVVSFSREDLQSWHFDHFCADKLTIVVVGDVETERLKDRVAAGFSKLPGTRSHARPGAPSRAEIAAGATPSDKPDRSPVARAHPSFSPPGESGSKDAPVGTPVEPDKIQTIESRIEAREKKQTALVLGFPGPKCTEEEYFALRIVQNVVSGLGGRFFEELRGRQSLAYTVSAYLVARQLGGTFFSYIATSPEKERTARDALLREFEKLTREPVSDDELGRAIQFTVGTHQIGLETCAAQMTQYAHSECQGKGFEAVDQLPERLRQVDSEMILEAVRRYFDTHCYAEGVVRGGVVSD
ncbi:MAG: M16 family metallopeptidase [bacterium]